MASAGRPLGSKSRFPSHGKIQDELLKHKFDWCAEFAKLYASVLDESIKVDLLLGLAPFLFPKRRPEDAKGESSDPVLAINVTPIDISDRVKAIKGES